MRRARVLAALAAAAVVPALGGRGVAAQAPAHYLWVATITPKLGQLPDWASFEQRIREARRRTHDPRSVYVYQLQAGGAANEFNAVIPFNDLSEMDSWPSVPDLLQTAYGEKDGARMYAEGTATEESVSITIQVLQPDWSSGNNVSVSNVPVTQLVTTRIRPELAADYNAFLAALKIAEDKRGIRRVRRTVTIGPQSTYTTVNQSSGWSDVRTAVAPPALVTQEYGEEVGGSLLARADAAVISRTIVVARLREDLSYTPN